MDIKIKDENCNFKMRVAGMFIKEDKVLGVQMCHNGFYCLPGGHIHVGENSEDAIKREVKEEIMIDCTGAKLIIIIENFFAGNDGKKVHEICYFYLLEGDIETKDFSYTENDEGVLKDLEFKWIKLDELEKYKFKPTILIDKLKSKNYNFEHIIFDQTK